MNKSAIIRAYSLSILLIFSSSLLSFGQNRQDTIKVELDEIEIKATHSALNASSAPYSFDLQAISVDDLNRSTAITLDEIGNRLPGIWINDRENFSLGERITIRGIGWRAAFGVRGIQILLDGIPLTVADGQSVLNVVDPVFIKRMELIRGPSSTFWGNSSGGVLYLSTRKPAADYPTLRLKSTGGSYGLKKFNIEYAQNTGRHNFNYYASFLDQNGYRDHSEARVTRIGFTGNGTLSNNQRLSYFGAFAAMPLAEHPSSLTNEQAASNPQQANQSFQDIGAGKEVVQGQVGLSYEKDINSGLFKATGYGILRDLDNPLPFAVIDLNRKAGGVRITYQKDLKSNFELNLGIESEIQHDDREEFENLNGQKGDIDVNQVENVFNNAVFATTAYSLHNFTLVAGLRGDLITFSTDAQSDTFSGNRTFDAFSPSLGIHYSTTRSEYYVNVSSGFESPTSTELVNRPSGGNGFNPNLRQESTISLEAGSRGFLRFFNLDYDIAVYRYWVEDLIFPFQLQADGPIFFRNQGTIRHWGTEISLEFRPVNNVSLGMIYSLTKARFERANSIDGQSLAGNQLPGVPDNRLTGFFKWMTKFLWLTMDYEYVSRYPVNNENTAFNDSYFVINARLSYPDIPISSNTRLVPYLSLNNLLDRQYNGSVVINAFGGRYYEPAADFNWRAGFSILFN